MPKPRSLRALAILAAGLTLAACDAYGPATQPSLTPVATSPPAPYACWSSDPNLRGISGFLTAGGGCVPADTLLALSCEGTPDELVRGSGTPARQRFVGGRFALSVEALPLNAELLGQEGDMQVFSVPHQSRWLFVRGGQTVQRWLALPTRPIHKPLAPPVSVAVSGGITPTVATPTATASTSPSPIPGKAPYVFFIGDSIARGGTPALQAYLPGWFTAFDAVVGRSSWAGVSIAASVAAQNPPPDVVVVELGTNDPDPAAFRTNAEEILTSLKDVPLVIWQTVHGPMSRVPDINTQIGQVVAGFPNTALADWDSFVPASDLTSDGVHPLYDHEDDMAKLLVPMLQGWAQAVARNAACQPSSSSQR